MDETDDIRPKNSRNHEVVRQTEAATYFVRNDLGLPKMSTILRDATTDDTPDGPVDRRASLWAGVFCSLFDVEVDDDPRERPAD